MNEENRFKDLKLNLCDDIEWDDRKRCYNVPTECWFDVDEVFGTKTRDKEDVWVNFYLEYYPDDDLVKPLVHVDTPNGTIDVPFWFNDTEAAYMYELFTEYVQKTTTYNSLMEMYMMDEIA